MESWRAAKDRRTPGFTWLRSLRPPPIPLGGAELACLRGHDNAVSSVAFDRDGRRIVSGARDGTVRVWDAYSGAELACLFGHDNAVSSVAFDWEGRRIVSGSTDTTVRVWDADSGAELACLRRHDNSVTSVAFDREGRRIVSGSWDDTVRVWDAVTGECLEEIQGSGDVAAIAAAASVFPWRTMSRNWETVIEPAGGGEAVAWFPTELGNLTTHPSGRILAGSVGNHVYLIRLEGEPHSIPRGGDS